MDRCDVIIPVWNHPEVTEDCIDSLVKNTAYPFRLIIIDNGSDDRTKRYLESLRGRPDLAVELIRNDENLGFVKAVNQGISASNENYICILNNDTLVMDGWLTEMINIAGSRKDIGIVNPSSNNLGQKPKEGEPVELYADKLKPESGRFVELGSGIGFCMLIKKEVIEKTGPFDEIYGMGNFEDTDFSRKAEREGYICVRACGAYVYHRENTSFNKMDAFQADFKRNREIYESRWGSPKRMAYIIDSPGPHILKRLNDEAMKMARGGNWVKYYSKTRVEIPAHSNITSEILGNKIFYLGTIYRILTKKKRFDEIFVNNEKLSRVLGCLSFIHRARVTLV